MCIWVMHTLTLLGEKEGLVHWLNYFGWINTDVIGFVAIMVGNCSLGCSKREAKKRRQVHSYTQANMGRSIA